jgi:hypothetical protein
MKKRLHNAIANFAIVLAAIACALVTGEIAFRAFDFTGLLPTSPHRLLTQYDPLLGWSKIPDKIGSHTTEEYSIIEHINSRGIRGPEYSYRKPQDEFRILILGDSFAEGYTVEFDQLFSERVKHSLNANSQQRYEVINAGTGGYSTDQELLLFQREGKLYSPDLTILLFYYNDVWYNQSTTYWRGAKPMFEIDGASLTLTNVPVPAPDKQSQSFFAGLKSWVNRNSFLYAAMKQASLRRSSRQAHLAGFGATSEDDVARIFSTELSVFRRPYDPRTARAWQATEALVAQLKQEASLVGSRLVVFYVPPRFAIYPDEWTATVRKDGSSDESWQYGWPAVEMAAICAKLGVDFIDPTARFRAVADQLAARQEGLYFVRDPHWNSRGHELVGDILTEYVRGVAD